jgi:hypothetical protein
MPGNAGVLRVQEAGANFIGRQKNQDEVRNAAHTSIYGRRGTLSVGRKSEGGLDHRTEYNLTTTEKLLRLVLLAGS